MFSTRKLVNLNFFKNNSYFLLKRSFYRRAIAFFFLLPCFMNTSFEISLKFFVCLTFLKCCRATEIDSFKLTMGNG